MSSSSNEDAAEKPRRSWRYGPLRLILPWVGMTVGILLTIGGSTGSRSPIFLLVGPGLIALSIAAFLLYRWMARRGI